MHRKNVAAAEGMRATTPRHKGTEKLEGNVKRRIPKLRTAQQKRPASRAGVISRVEREGAAQVALAGPPNSGKSSLLRRLTRATPEVADYPFTTRMPAPGMMDFEDVQIQLIDLPPLHPHFRESWLYQIIRNTDATVLVVDLADPDLLQDLEATLAELEGAKVRLGKGP